MQPIAAVMGLFVPGFFGLDPASVELVRQRRDITVLPDDSVYGNEAAQGMCRLPAAGSGWLAPRRARACLLSARGAGSSS